jgi:hypothetical protein
MVNGECSILNCERLRGGDAGGGLVDEPGWAELRDGAGKLQGKWDPVTGVLEIQRRGVKTRHWLDRHGETRAKPEGGDG